jgi:hypothetical protein
MNNDNTVPNDNNDEVDDECPLPIDTISVPEETSTTTTTTTIRPLHYVVTFSRSKPLGLILSEATTTGTSSTSIDEYQYDNPKQLDLWKISTIDAIPGQVFIQDIVPNGQADTIGIFHIGDRFHGVGDLSFNNEGFERAVELVCVYFTLYFKKSVDNNFFTQLLLLLLLCCIIVYLLMFVFDFVININT